MIIHNKSINCFCYPPERCEFSDSDSSSCVSSTGCFTSKNIIGNSESIISGCFSNDIFHMQLMCIGVSIYCCSDEDYCNRKHILGNSCFYQLIFILTFILKYILLRSSYIISVLIFIDSVYTANNCLIQRFRCIRIIRRRIVGFDGCLCYFAGLDFGFFASFYVSQPNETPKESLSIF